MPAETGNAVYQSTKSGLTCEDNLHNPIGNNSLSQAQPAVQGISLQILQNTMSPTPFADSDFVTVMANLATATSADHQTVATLTKAISTLTDQLKAKDIRAKSQEAELKRLLGSQGNVTPIVSNGQSNAYVRKSYKTKNDNYCWSHGYQVVLAHTSTNCTKKAPCHKDVATNENIMGGDNGKRIPLKRWGRSDKLS
jgi:hypothetical protein